MSGFALEFDRVYLSGFERLSTTKWGAQTEQQTQSKKKELGTAVGDPVEAAAWLAKEK